MLKAQTLFEDIDLVSMAIDRLKTFEPPEGYYLAFSGGKDSIVVKALADMAGVKYDAHYNLTTVDPPELVYYIRQHHPDVQIHKPKESMFQLIARKGIVPTRVFRFCCGILKERGGEGRRVLTGVRWSESARRSKRQMFHSCYKDKSKYMLQPIIDWKEEDVWQFIKEQNLPYCSLYDAGFKRLGCIMCPMAGTDQMLRDAKRWPKIAEAYKRAMNRAVDTRRAKGLECREDFASGDTLYHWWVYQPAKGDPDQTVMFE